MTFAIALDFEDPIFQFRESRDAMVARMRVLWNPNNLHFSKDVRPDSKNSNHYQICAANDFWCYFQDNNPFRVVIHSRYETGKATAAMLAFGHFYQNRFGGEVVELQV